jgi:penicillin-binding protein 1A
MAAKLAVTRAPEPAERASNVMGTVRYLVRFVAICAAVSVIGSALTFLLVPQLAAIGSANHGVAAPINLDALPQRSLIYDSKGGVAATLFADQNRSSVPLSQVPHSVQAAVLAVEDENFYSHKGINLRATIRALFTNVSSGEVQQGGSTITMQLIKNSLPAPKRDLERKTQEAVLAWRLEQVMSKNQILERYLNTVYFGNGAYGVQAAAEVYFGKNVSDLDWPEAALLASLIRDPRDYDPFTNPSLAIERRHLALQRLVETGNLSQGEADLYNFTPLPTVPSQIAEPPRDYFLDQVKQLLLDDPSFNLGSDYTERYNAVFEGGLHIYTTLDPTLQTKALDARNGTLPGQDPNGLFVINGASRDVAQDCPQLNDGNGHCRGTIAMVSVDPATGAVRNLVGGPGFDKWKYDLATQATRQPGSSMKAFVLATALEQGINVTDTISGSTCSFPNPQGTPNPYTQKGESGTETLIKQLASSVNCAFLRLGQIVGINNVIAQARKMGVTSPLKNVVSFPLGVNDVSPLEMAGAYAAIDNDGVLNAPYFIDKITDSTGKVIYQHTPTPTRVMSEQSARQETVAMQAVVTSGTGTQAQLPNGRPAAGKTGTTDEHGDAWFIGFTPQLTTAVWMGSPESVVPMQNVGGINVFGGTFPALVWHNFMAQAMDGLPVVGFTPPGPTPPSKFLALPFENFRNNTPPRSGGTRNTPTTPAPPASPATPAPGAPAPAPTAGGNGNGNGNGNGRGNGNGGGGP